MKHWIISALLLAASGFAFGQSPQLRSGATIYIQLMDGYETYLAAALVKKGVPLVVVTQEEKVEYILRGGVAHHEPSHPDAVVNNSADASITEDGNGGGNTATASAFQRGWASGERAAAARAAAKAALGYSTASISIVDPKSTQIVFAYSAGKDGKDQSQKTAEEFAKHLKEFIEKSEKEQTGR